MNLGRGARMTGLGRLLAAAWLVAALAAGVAAAAGAIRPDRARVAPPSRPVPPSGLPDACANVNGTTMIPNPPTYTVAAGSGMRITGCNWFPRTTCSNRVRFKLTANGTTYDLGGAIRPERYAVGFQSTFPYVIPTLSAIDGFVSVPEGVNLGTGPIQATLTGSQILDLSLPVLGCFDVIKKSSHPTTVTVTPAASDSSVITRVVPADGSTFEQGKQLHLSWTLSRAGEVRIHVYYELTDGRELSVRPGTYPADAVLDEKRPSGANEFTMQLADAGGHAFPAGGYRYEIELLDPAGSQLVPAKPKGASFTVTLAG